MKPTFIDITEEDLTVYPDSDGKPMADNTRQFNYIVRIKENLEKLFFHNANVFVAGDLLWYPVRGNAKICAAPDAMVVFGRPKGYRGSYIQHREAGLGPQVVFEILSDSNTRAEMSRKRNFYETHGVEEYYIYNPDNGDFKRYERQDEGLIEVEAAFPFISPLLNVRFEMQDIDLALFYPDGNQFKSVAQLSFELESEQQRAEFQEERATLEERRANAATQKANAENERANLAIQKANAEKERADRLAAQLRALGIEPDEN
jgi:Uma2 family endonuclease